MRLPRPCDSTLRSHRLACTSRWRWKRSGRLSEAVTEYQEALRLEPERVDAAYGLSSTCGTLGDLEGAIVLLRGILSGAPGFAEAHYNLGLYLWQRSRRRGGAPDAGDLDAALAEAAAAVRLAPARADFHAALGQMLADKQDLTGAVGALRQARTLDAANYEHAYNLGLALRMNGNLDQAETELRAALRGHPGHGLARRALGLVLRQRDDLQGAAAELRAAVTALPRMRRRIACSDSVLLKLDDPAAALAPLRAAIALDPGLTDARAMLAQALARTGARDEAREQQAEIQRINVIRAAMGRALVLLEGASERTRVGDRAGAIARLREAVAISPTLAEAQFQLGAALRHSSGHTAEAEAALREAVRLDPDEARAHYELGLARASAGDLQGAALALRRATVLAPGLVAAQRELAAVARRQQDWPSVAAALTAVLAWSPVDAQARSGLQEANAHRSSRPPADHR